jgi:hypothetical protein
MGPQTPPPPYDKSSLKFKTLKWTKGDITQTQMADKE